MEARLIALEDRLRQTEEVKDAERLARQTAEVAQQTVGHSQLVLVVVRDLLSYPAKSKKTPKINKSKKIKKQNSEKKQKIEKFKK